MESQRPYSAWLFYRAIARGKNYGKLILDAATDFAKNQGYRQMTLHAQLSAKGFYQRMQFKSLEQEFEEAGIKHITMTKALS